MRLRRKPWIDEAVKEYESFVCLDAKEEMKGRWRSLFADPAAPLWVEIGTGKGNFIAQMAQLHGDVNFIGIEVQLGVLYYAAKKCAAAETENVRLLRFDAVGIDFCSAGDRSDFHQFLRSVAEKASCQASFDISPFSRPLLPIASGRRLPLF